MRKITGFAVSCTILCFTVIAFWGCIKDKVTKTYTIERPIYKPLTEVLAAVNGNAAEPVRSAGKLYIKGTYIFLNEVDKGIHVIDNTNPSHPVQTAFLSIPGNRDMAVKGNILYADMYASLLAIDISDIHHVSIKKSISRFFMNRLFYNHGVYIDSNRVLVDLIKKDTTITVEPNPQLYTLNSCANCSFYAQSNANALQSGSSTGTAGSMAAMVLLNNYLYAITGTRQVDIVNISDAASPALSGTMNPGADLQTIYPFKDKLFLGSAIGMYIMDVSDPVHPKSAGQFSHVRACDPVVTDGTYAYVTLHTGTRCGGTFNELEVLNVQNVLNPTLVKIYPLSKPTGLCKDGDLLFVCDGSNGVKLYDASNVSDLKLLQQIKCNDPYDVIATNNHALVVTKEGLYQYDYSNPRQIKQLSAYSTKQ